MIFLVPEPAEPAVARLLSPVAPWLSCDECFERLDAYAEASVAGEPTDQLLTGHLADCAACAEEADSLIELITSEQLHLRDA